MNADLMVLLFVLVLAVAAVCVTAVRMKFEKNLHITDLVKRDGGVHAELILCRNKSDECMRETVKSICFITDAFVHNSLPEKITTDENALADITNRLALIGGEGLSFEDNLQRLSLYASVKTVRSMTANVKDIYTLAVKKQDKNIIFSEAEAAELDKLTKMYLRSADAVCDVYSDGRPERTGEIIANLHAAQNYAKYIRRSCKERLKSGETTPANVLYILSYLSALCELCKLCGDCASAYAGKTYLENKTA